MADLDPRFTLGDLAQQRDQVAAPAGRRRLARRQRAPPAEPGAAARRRRHQRRHRGLARLPRRARSAAASGSTLVRVPTPGSRASAPRRWSRRAHPGTVWHAARRGLDAIVVIRGGGARNELAMFDAEPIARAIAAAPVPVLTGLGHEIDRSVADEVAHTVVQDADGVRPVARRRPSRQYLAAAERSLRAPSSHVAARHDSTAPPSSARRPRPPHRPAHPRRRRAGRRAARRRGSTRLRARRRRPLVDARTPRRRRAASGSVPRAPQLLAAEERHLDVARRRGSRSLDPVNVLARGLEITRTADGRVVRVRRPTSPPATSSHTELADGTLRSR